MQDLGHIDVEERPNNTRDTIDIWRLYFTVLPAPVWFRRATSVEVDPPYRVGKAVSFGRLVIGVWTGSWPWSKKDEDQGLYHSMGGRDLEELDPNIIGDW